VRALIDTSILIDYLRGHAGAEDLLERERAADVLHASEITRIEVLAGMRPSEEDGTRALLSTLVWHPVDAEIAEAAGALLDAARGLVADLDPEAQPRSAAAARQLLVACAGLFMDAQEGCA